MSLAVRRNDEIRHRDPFEPLKPKQKLSDAEAAGAPGGDSRIGENNLYADIRKKAIEVADTARTRTTEAVRAAAVKEGLIPGTPTEAVEQIKRIPLPNPADRAAHDAYIRQTQTIAQGSLAAAQPPKRENYNNLPTAAGDAEFNQATEAYNSAVAGLQPYAEGTSYVRYDATVNYMFGEMKGNLNSPEFKAIKYNLDLAKNPPPLSDPGANMTAALGGFAYQVRSGGEWDHKPILKEKLGLVTENTPGGPPIDQGFPIRGDAQHEVDYDIWSNIHYGYVGTAAGFDQGTLQTAAALKIPGVTGGNDPVDVVTTQIGIDMWNKYGANLTKEQFETEVRTRIPEIIVAQETQEYKDINGNFQHVDNINDTNRR